MNNREKLAYCQSALKAPKDLKNNFGNYNYRSCESILEALKPILKEVDALLTMSDKMVAVGERVYVETTITFQGTTSEEEPIIVTASAREAVAKKGMDDAQITGAASSYTRKYGLNAMFLIDDTKDADTMDNSPEKVTDENVDKMIDHAKEKGLSATASIQMLEKKYTVSAEQKKLIKDEVK
jgi:hypothetical protein